MQLYRIEARATVIHHYVALAPARQDAKAKHPSAPAWVLHEVENEEMLSIITEAAP